MEIRALKDEASRLFSKGKYARCIEVYERLIDVEPKDPQLRLRLAEAQRRANDFRQAIASYQVAASLLAESGHYSRAIAALKIALQLAPDHEGLKADLKALEGKRAVMSGGITPPTPYTPRRPLPAVEKPVEVAPAAEAEPVEIRRLSDSAIAIRRPGDSRWMILSSGQSIDVQYADGLPWEGTSVDEPAKAVEPAPSGPPLG